ncbi:MAG: beta-glucosidase, partial [Actinomycetia bacterium]|nr:beta-glucosidase [Actinomycetes bacterium]
MTNEPSSVSSSLTLEEKVTLVSGQDVWRTSAITRLGLGAIKVTDGPVGARGDSTTGARAVCLPATIGLAATFDRDLAIEFGRLLGRETKRKGAQVLLAPTVNMARHPLGGRNFESFGEDPLLTAQMAVAYVQGVQSEGVAACGKHFVANDVEYSRMTISSEVSDTLLREIYLAPFEALVEAGIWSLMASYPKLNGQFCTENHWLLTTLLRQEWGFDGLVMSDWGATHHRSRPTLAGLDLEMPGPAQALGPNLLAAITDGEVSEDDIDGRVQAVVALADRTGRLGLTEAESA